MKHIRNVRYEDRDWIWLKMVAEEIGVGVSDIVREGAKQEAKRLLALKKTMDANKEDQ